MTYLARIKVLNLQWQLVLNPLNHQLSDRVDLMKPLQLEINTTCNSFVSCHTNVFLWKVFIFAV